MRLRTAPALEGLLWMRSGLLLLRRETLSHIAWAGFMLFGLGLLLSIPRVGPILALTLMPTLSAGWVAGTEQLLQGIRPLPVGLISPLLHSASTRRRLVLLGLLHALATAVLLMLADLIDPGFQSQLQASFETQSGTAVDSAAAQSAVQTGLLLRLALMVPISLLFWHAPVILHRTDTSVGKALFASAMASLRNLRAMVMFGLGWFGLNVLVSIGLSVLIPLFGSGDLAAFLIVPILLAFTAAFYASLHASVQGCLIFDSPSRSEPDH
jgi:hypothetical protein